MHPFRLAKLVAGVVLVAVAMFAAQWVFADSVEPSILEIEKWVSGELQLGGHRSLRAREREPVSDACERSGREAQRAPISLRPRRRAIP